MNRRRWYPTMVLVLATSACFHQAVRTGRPASQTVVDKPWVNTWLWGLVAAQPLDVRQVRAKAGPGYPASGAQVVMGAQPPPRRV